MPLKLCNVGFCKIGLKVNIRHKKLARIGSIIRQCFCHVMMLLKVSSSLLLLLLLLTVDVIVMSM